MTQILTNRIIFALSLLGVQIAGYLTLAHLNILALVCGIQFGCDRVAHHPTAHGFGIPALAAVPTAAFGLAFFALLVGLSAWRAAVHSPRALWGVGALLWGFALAGILLSGWLTFLEAYVIHGWCLWCLASAVVTVAIFVTITCEMLLAARPARPEPASVRAHRPAEASRFLMILLVALLFDGSTTLALRRTPPASLHTSTSTVNNTRRAELILPQAHRYGNPAAPYTLVEFGDYACPHCQEAQQTVEHILASKPKALNYVFYFYPIADDSHGVPSLAARAAEAAAREDKFWPMHFKLFAEARARGDEANAVTLPWVLSTVQSLGLDQARFHRSLTDIAVIRAVQREEALGDRIKLAGVPAFFIVLPSDKVIHFDSVRELETWVAVPGHLR